ncbi:MAG: hypothetical protein ACE5HY_02710 [Candidatus Hydrothermarchaeales archaeon]
MGDVLEMPELVYQGKRSNFEEVLWAVLIVIFIVVGDFVLRHFF